MRLTRFTDNALRCLIALGVSDGRPVSTGDIARQMHMSEDHLNKVVHRLVQLELVHTTRGRGGGIQLAKEPSAIVIGTVVRATEDNLLLVECFDAETNTCPIAPACRLAPALSAALQAFLGVLDRYTLADLVNRPRNLQQLLRVG